MSRDSTSEEQSPTSSLISPKTHCNHGNYGSVRDLEIQPVTMVTTDQSSTSKQRKRKMLKNVLDSAPGLILLGATFLFQTMPSTYLPVILKEEFDFRESTSAIIISASTFSYIGSCFISPKLDDYLDSDVILVTSYFIFLLTGVSFSFVTSLPRYMIPSVAIALRALAGFAAGVYENILSTVFVRKFPENIGALCASIEAVINIGCLVGPILGGALYTWTGKFSTTCLIPLFAAGVFFIWFVVQVSQDLRCGAKQSVSSTTSSTSNHCGGFLEVLSYWQILLTLFLPFYGSFVSNLPLTITAPYIEKRFNKGSVAAGFIFLVEAFGYLIFVMISGFLTDRPRFKSLYLWFFSLCPFVQSFGNLLVGPSFFLPLTSSYTWIVVGLAINSSALGLACGPGLRSLTALWRGLHPDSESDFSAYLTSLYLVTFSLGEGAGNAVGGVLYDYISYNSIITSFGLSLCLHGLVNTIFIISSKNKRYMKEVVGVDYAGSPLLAESNFTENESESENELKTLLKGKRT
ncbi:hypothetical protein ACHWQZ_G017156 [Mnemiopsis leidyi]